MQHFFFYSMLHPTSSFMFFVSTTPSIEGYFVLLHVHYLPPLSLFFCVQSSKCVTFFLMLCVAPTPFLYVYCAQSSKCATCFFVSKPPSVQYIFFSIVCCTCPPLLFVFFVSKVPTHNLFCFLLCVALPPSFAFFCPNFQACNTFFFSTTCCICPFLLCFLCPQFQMCNAFFFGYVLHPPPFLYVFCV